MQPNPALSALKPADTIADATVDDGWDRPMTDWAALSFNTPLNIQMSADMFARIQFHATAEDEDEEEYVGNELICHIDDGEAINDYKRRQAQDPERFKAECSSTEELREELGIEDDDACAGAPSGNDEDGPNKEANLDDDAGDF